jgi:hypothetical protein
MKMNEKLENYENLGIGECQWHGDICMRTLKTSKNLDDINKEREKYLSNGFYCVIKEKQKYAALVERKDGKEIKHEFPYYALIGINVNELQRELNELKRKRNIEIDLIKELIFSDNLPTMIANNITNFLLLERNINSHRYPLSGEGRQESM